MKSGRFRVNSRFRDEDTTLSRRRAKPSSPNRLWMIIVLIVLFLTCGIYIMYLHAPATDSSFKLPVTMYNAMSKISNHAASDKVSYPIHAQLGAQSFETHKQGPNFDFPVCPFDPVQGCELDQRIRYWKEPADCIRSALYKSPQNISEGDRKYLVYQPDLGGWNNIRMAAEVAVVFAHATGRTLVLAPDSILYLLMMNKNHKKNKSNLDDFYEFRRILDGLDVITMEEFLQKEASIPGRLKETWSNGFDLSTPESKKQLYSYLERTCFVRQWSPGKIFIGFNITKDPRTEKILFGTFDSQTDHIKAFMFNNRQLVPYDSIFHSERAIYFPGHDQNRMLTHFYSYLFFADMKLHRYYLRFVRDRLRYLDSIFCTAARVIDLIQNDALKMMNTDARTYERVEFFYHAMHIRRGDFQQKHTRWPAEKILNHTLHLLDKRVSRLLYIATDERNISFFDPFREHFTVKLLGDYMITAHVDDVNQNHLGMIEQIVCANSYVFIGTPLSTFSNFISRMRGYYNSTISPGRFSRTYYFMPSFMYQLHNPKTNKMSIPLWTREFVDGFEYMND